MGTIFGCVSVNCLTRILGILFSSTWLLAACTFGNGDYFSGHTVGIIRADKILDFGDIRAEISVMRSARNFPIPETRYFNFGRTPQGHERIFVANNWRRPTRSDWQNYLELSLTATDWSGYADPARAQRQRITTIQNLEAEDATSEYKSWVLPDGQIGQISCRTGRKRNPNHCMPVLEPSMQERLELAQALLTHFEPGCQLGQVDPPQVTGLYPNYGMRPRSLVATIECN